MNIINKNLCNLVMDAIYIYKELFYEFYLSDIFLYTEKGQDKKHRLQLFRRYMAGKRTSPHGFFETVVEYYRAQTDDLKYGAFSSPYILVLNKMIERHYNDGKYLLGRADYYKKYEDYDAARDDYIVLLDIYPDDLWFPFVISSTYRKQEMKDEAKVYMRYIKKHAPEIKTILSNRVGSGEDPEVIKSVMESNELINTLVTDMLKIKFPIKIDK